MIDGVLVPKSRTPIFTFISLKHEGSTLNLFASLDFKPFASDDEQINDDQGGDVVKPNKKHGNNGMSLCLHL
jgi:hypothetical protein